MQSPFLTECLHLTILHNMSEIYAILSPAKTLEMSLCKKQFNCSKPRFETDSHELVDAMSKFSVSKLSKLMKISEKLSSLNVQRWKLFNSKDNAFGPAAMSFRGHVYQGFEAWSLDDESIEWAQNHIRILSGLYGLLRPMDKIQPYRLEMGTKLKTQRGKNLYEYWGDSISKLLRKDLRAIRSKCLFNLASKEYAKAIDFQSLDVKVVSVDFLEKKGSGTRFISFDAKTARGLMARWMSLEKPRSISDVKEFNLNGYTFDQLNSTDFNFVFTRKKPASRKAS